MLTKLKIGDKITLGAVSGIISSLIVDIINYFSFILNLHKWHLVHISASVYFKVKDVGTLPALFVGVITHFTVCAILGIVVCYTLYYTGTDFYWLKGIGACLVFWLLVFGIMLRVNIGRIDPTDAATNVFYVSAHIMRGWLVAYLITKLAKEGVFER